MPPKEYRITYYKKNRKGLLLPYAISTTDYDKFLKSIDALEKDPKVKEVSVFIKYHTK